MDLGAVILQHLGDNPDFILTLKEGSGQEQLCDSQVQEESNWLMSLTPLKLHSALGHTNDCSACSVSKHFLKKKKKNYKKLHPIKQSSDLSYADCRLVKHFI